MIIWYDLRELQIQESLIAAGEGLGRSFLLLLIDVLLVFSGVRRWAISFGCLAGGPKIVVAEDTCTDANSPHYVGCC